MTGTCAGRLPASDAAAMHRAPLPLIDPSARRGNVASGACHPTFHRPPRPARAARRAGRPRRQPALVLAPGDARTSSRPSTPTLWESTGGDPVRLLGAVGRGAARRAGRGRGVPRRGSRAAHADLDGLPDRRPLVPAPARRGRRRSGRDRLLLAGVRHHRRAAAVLRRPRHPGRRPPQGRQRPRRADHRRRPALPARLLQAVAVPRGLAAGELPGPRPRRAADLAAARGERRAAR